MSNLNTETFGKLEDGTYDVIDVSLDIETYSLQPNAAVISIGCCTHDEQFEVYFSRDSQMRFDRNFDEETIKWHLDNHSELYLEMQHKVQTVGGAISTGLIELNHWFRNRVCGNVAPAIQVWMNSPSFDSVILNDMAKQIGTELPWSYREERDLRTLKAMAKTRNADEYALLPSPPDNAHDALADAKYQLEIISRCKTILNC